MIRTRNLLIWSQTRYRCATESHLFMWVENALHYCCSTFSFVYPLQRKTLALKVRLVVQNTFSIMPLLPTSAVRTTRKASQVLLLRSHNATKIIKCVVCMTYQQSTVGQYFIVVSREKFVDFLQVYGGVHLSLVQLRPNRSGYLAVGKLGPVETLQWVGRLQKSITYLY